MEESTEFNRKTATHREKLEEATKNLFQVFKTSRNPNWKQGKKYYNLPNYELDRSIELLKETTKGYSISKNQKIYKRGSLIYVDFGVNVGGEFSGPHFAIVLNKNDNSRNEKLLVVPLTSKRGDHRVHLSDTISEASAEYLTKSFNLIFSSVYSLVIIREVIIDALSDESLDKQSFDRIKMEQLTEMVDHFRPENDDHNAIDYLENLLKDMSNSISNVTDCTNFLKMNYLPFILGKKVDEVTDDDLFSMINGETTNDLLDDFNQFQYVFSKYMEYNKESHARVADLTTLSKRRIRTINRHDPIGKIHVSSETLDSIDDAIKESFLK